MSEYSYDMQEMCCSDPMEIQYAGELVCRNCGTVREKIYRNFVPYEEISFWSAPLIPFSRELNEVLEGVGLSFEKKIVLLSQAKCSSDPLEFILRALHKMDVKIEHKVSKKKGEEEEIHEYQVNSKIIKQRVKQIRQFDKLRNKYQFRELTNKTRFTRGKYYYWKNKIRGAKQKKTKKILRRSKLDPYMDQIRIWREKRGYTLQIIQTMLCLEYGIDVSVKTIHQVLKEEMR